MNLFPVFFSGETFFWPPKFRLYCSMINLKLRTPSPSAFVRGRYFLFRSGHHYVEKFLELMKCVVCVNSGTLTVFLLNYKSSFSMNYEMNSFDVLCREDQMFLFARGVLVEMKSIKQLIMANGERCHLSELVELSSL